MQQGTKIVRATGKKKNKSIKTIKEVKSILFADDVIQYSKDPKEYTIKILDLINILEMYQDSKINV
jgi:hypothetical protein